MYLISYFFNSLPKKMKNQLLTEPSVTTGHEMSLGTEQFHLVEDLYEHFKATVFTEIGGVPTYSAVENNDYGWFLFQFHPEKCGNIFVPYSKALQSDLGLRFGFETAMFFVNECRKNSHTLVDETLLLYNVSPNDMRSNEFVSRPNAKGVPGYYHTVYLLKEKSNKSIQVEKPNKEDQ